MYFSHNTWKKICKHFDFKFLDVTWILFCKCLDMNMDFGLLIWELLRFAYRVCINIDLFPWRR